MAAGELDVYEDDYELEKIRAEIAQERQMK